ncbi:choice-of-anchor X domain-containing protein [Salinarimonas sp.]|uniref:choice-of-anchor X domain-containing protein n=1 Tax=Salinarimonas sp. TaxID=2766526 RepID=UPI00391B09E8
MAVTDLVLANRPFAVEYFTDVMMPDGIFDTALYFQRITAFMRNTSGQDLVGVSVWLEGVSDPGIVPTGHTFTFPVIPAGAAVRVSWLADFRNGKPGKPIVSIMAQASGQSPRRSMRRIFVSRTTYDEATKSYVIEVPEGSLKVWDIATIGPRSDAWKPKCDPDERDERLGPWVPTRFQSAFTPNPPYAGIHGDLPFADPWWKILGWVVFGVASLVAAILAATGGGTAYVGVKGKFDDGIGEGDPSVDCCDPDWKSVTKETGLDKGKITGAGVASAIATAGMAVGLADDADPWWRGQEATPPPAGALTTSEAVAAKLVYLDPPNAGRAYRVRADWRYERVTTAGSFDFAVDEVRESIHVSDGVEVKAKSPIKGFSEPLRIEARFAKKGKEVYRGIELYAYALVVSPDATWAGVVPLSDDGIGPDKKAEDGVYSGQIHLESVFPILRKRKAPFAGKWRVLVFAQDVNLADPKEPPEIQAQTIGGFMIASAIALTFDPNLPCPIEAQAVVEVVM